MSDIKKIINDAWEIKDKINQNSDKSIKDAINQVIEDLDCGKSRVAEKINGEWVTHQHLKKAIMLSFRLYGMSTMAGPYSTWIDKSHLLKGKTAGWTNADFEKAGFLIFFDLIIDDLFYCLLPLVSVFDFSCLEDFVYEFDISPFTSSFFLRFIECF